MKEFRASTSTLLALIVAFSLLLGACAKGEPAPAAATAPSAAKTAPPPTEVPSANTSQASTAPPKTLEIGVLTSLTGPASSTGKRLGDGIQAAAVWLNGKGGLTIGGEKYLIKTVVADAKADVPGAIDAVNKLVYDSKVKFIIGPLAPMQSSAVAPITEKNLVLRVRPDASVPGDLGSSVPHTFATASGLAAFPNVYEYLVQAYPTVKTIAVSGQDNPQSAYAMDQIKRIADSHTLKVVATEVYPFGTSDFYPVWTKIMAAKPDAVDLGFTGTTFAAQMFKQGREMGFKGPIYSSSIGIVDLIIGLGPNLATDFFNYYLDIESPELPPITKEITKVMLDRFHEPPNYEQFMGWTSLWYLAQAIEASQSLDPTKVSVGWEKMQVLQSPFGPAKMGGLKSWGINHVGRTPLPLGRVMNGKFQFVKWVTPDVP